jgi:CopG family transcriptional regulator, nickel-responsive regulator
LQHDHHSLIVSTMHVHLTHTLCLEVIVLRGPSAALQKMASQLKGLKGIYKGELVMANAEES